MEKIFFHIDFDAFYASVEQLDNPETKNKPVVVGALPGQRGVVSSCSYEARRYGIRSAMPISEAFRRCPDGIYLPVRMKRYIELSRSCMKLLAAFAPIFQQISIDEAYLDMTGTKRLLGDPVAVAKDLKEKIKKKTGLDVSIGIAENRYLAKMASEFGKPDGLYRVHPGKEEMFLDQLQLKDLWGIGDKMLAKLQKYNIKAVKNLRDLPVSILESMFGKKTGQYLFRACRGLDPGIHNPVRKSHSIGSETTFGADVADTGTIKKVIFRLSHHVMDRLISEGWETKTIHIKIRYHDFFTLTRQTTAKHVIQSAEEIFHLAEGLLDAHWNGRTPLRLVGVSATQLFRKESLSQLELFEDEYDRKRKVEEVATKLNKNYKGKSLIKANLLSSSDKRSSPNSEKGET